MCRLRETGVSGTIERVGTGIKSKFTDTNDQVIDAYIAVRPDVIAALDAQLRSGNLDVRANAARAKASCAARRWLRIGAALRTKDSTLIYESLVALQKIGDYRRAGVEFLLHDFDPKVQIAAIETVGLLRDAGAVPALADVTGQTDNLKVKRAALTSLAMLPDPAYRGIYQRYFHDKDEKLRGRRPRGWAAEESARPARAAAGLEGRGQARPRLSLAFAQVMLGRPSLANSAPCSSSSTI